MRRPRVAWGAGGILLPAVLAATAALLAASDALWRIDLMFYDVMGRAFFKPAPTDVVLVAIDEKSLTALGRWPWPRHHHAALVEKLSAAGVAAIAYDVAFVEPAAPEDDERLARVLRANGAAVLPVVPEQSATGGIVETMPLPALAAAARLGHVDVELDPDGLARSVYLRAGLGAPRWPAFARAVLDVVEGRAPSAPGPVAGGSGASLWSRADRILVAFTGPPGTFRQLSFSDVLSRPLPSDWPARAVVFVGLTAAGLGDALPTPVSGHARPMPGVEFVANAFECLRTDSGLRYLSLRSTVALTGGLVLAAALVVAAFPRPLWAALGALALVAGLSLLLLRIAHAWFTPAATFAGCALSYPLALWIRHRLDREFLRRAQALSRTALSSVAEAVLTTDRAGLVEYANPVAEAWLGRPAEDLVGMRLEAAIDLRAPDDQPLRVGELAGQLVDAVLVSGRRRRGVRASLTPIGPRGDGNGLVVALTDARQAPASPPGSPATRRDDAPPHRARTEAPPDDVRTTAGWDRPALERDLRRAIAEGGLELLYQPQLDLARDAIVGVEALLRWRHPVHGTVPPAVFVAAAEGSGLIEPLGAWVLREACRQATAWTREGLPELRMAVNLSPLQIAQPGLPAAVAAALDQAGLEPGRLTLELTESARLLDLDATASVFAAIRSTGVSLALDDFGVGYSSLAHLRKLPVDIVKIDKSFVEEVTADSSSRSICLAVLAMAQSLGRRVVAEGVETAEQAEFFRSRGCDEIQGFLVSPPLEAGALKGLLSSRRGASVG